MNKINSDNTSMFCYLCNKLAAMVEGLKINEFTSRCIVLLPLNDSGEFICRSEHNLWHNTQREIPLP